MRSCIKSHCTRTSILVRTDLEPAQAGAAGRVPLDVSLSWHQIRRLARRAPSGRDESCFQTGASANPGTVTQT